MGYVLSLTLGSGQQPNCPLGILQHVVLSGQKEVASHWTFLSVVREWDGVIITGEEGAEITWKQHGYIHKFIESLTKMSNTNLKII